ncbi:hypothetical protein KY289_000580 [Solanum tuberosum]|nr:hypothetical protein KY289_000580 [Solanum tuberosum]
MLWMSVGEGLQQGVAQSENINVEVCIDDVLDLEGVETDLDISDNSQKFAIPENDDLEIDEELRTLRNERRIKLQRKNPFSTKDLKTLKGTRLLDLDSNDSRGELDPEVVDGVDLPARRRSKKDKKDNWLLYASLEKDSGEFMVKNYYLVQQCTTSTKNKLCTYKFIAK